MLVDDRSSAVSLPEVPLLGVLPGTGGLTRLIDKRKVRRDLADIFCTTAEGVRAERAKEWRLVDDVAKPQQFAEVVKARALAARRAVRPARRRRASTLTPLGRTRPAIATTRRRAIDARRARRRITVDGPPEQPRSSETQRRDW